jgi:trehalose-phosphatase
VVVVINGRALGDLVTNVGLPVVYAGNHGLEIRGMGLEYAALVDQRAGVQLSDCCDALRGRLERFPGASIEYKQRTASLHVRQLARFQLPAVEDLVRSTMANYAKLQLCHGKEVFEIRPNIAWNKGCAAPWIQHQMEETKTGAICIGDDSTDEDMFRELNNGITIRIGAESDSAAQYWIAGAEVARFLSFLLETLGLRRSG